MRDVLHENGLLVRSDTVADKNETTQSGTSRPAQFLDLRFKNIIISHIKIKSKSNIFILVTACMPMVISKLDIQHIIT